MIGLGTEFRSEKIPRNRLKMVSVIPRKKVLIRGIPSSAEEESIPILGTEQNGTELYFLGMVQNGIPTIFCSAEQPECRWK
jgi:hypothetical protein